MFKNQSRVASSLNRTFEMCELHVLVNNNNPVPSGAYLEIIFPS
jgi:hypothetical protein